MAFSHLKGLGEQSLVEKNKNKKQSVICTNTVEGSKNNTPTSSGSTATIYSVLTARFRQRKQIIIVLTNDGKQTLFHRYRKFINKNK